MIDSIKNFSDEEIKTLIDNTANKLNINNAIVEKDFWVCVMLDFLFNKSAYSDALIFKGGTSLSKCFDIIHRFSEDIDLILNWEYLGIEPNEPFEYRSNTQQDKYNDILNNKAADFIRDILLPNIKDEMKQYLEKEIKIEVDKEDGQVINFYYPKMYNNDSILQYIRLEIGPLAATTPSQYVEIEPYINTILSSNLKMFPITVLTVDPERTFWEKATILHREANRPLYKPMPKRYARHYYDLYMFSKTDYYKKALKKKSLLELVIKFKEKFYRDNWANYDDCLNNNFKFPSDKVKTSPIFISYARRVFILFSLEINYSIFFNFVFINKNLWSNCSHPLIHMRATYNTHLQIAI